jgi:hypothetical protein
MHRIFVVAIMLVLPLVLAPAIQAAAPDDIEITTCGQVIPKKTLGFLTANLDCTGFTGGPTNVDGSDLGAAVYIERKGRLDLRGFTLTGGRRGVLCDALRCGHNSNNNNCSKGPCEIFNGSLVASSPSDTLGVTGFRPIIHDVTISGFYFGVVSFEKLQLSNAAITDSAGAGVAGKTLALTNTTVTNSGQFGVLAWTDRGKAVRLTNSSVTGSGTQSFCGDFACADVAAMRRPRLESSSCGSSFNMMENGGTWGVCTGD